ncbi:hypothetical protein [Cerasicoccus maritimus]|uniref:hypothetical protein n=1 Tax=Cerasicoccus maritimus TaxID=490089 RepID=UPI00285249B5|nr:hypothetical protein [Cerasicoccus maritimus]
MEIVALILMAIGGLIALIFGIQLLIIAFKTHILWGLGYIFVPFCSLVFIIMYWDDCKSPFLKSLIAIPFVILGSVVAGMSAGAQGGY